MRFTFCAYDRPNYVNGPNVWLARLAGALGARGHRVRVLLQRSRGAGPLASALGALDVELAIVERPRFTEDCVRWILERVAESPPDVFVPNLSVPAYYAARWVREAGISTVGVLHSDEPFYWGLADEFARGPEPWRLSAMVCVSRFLEERLLESSPPGLRVARIPCGAPAPEEAATAPDGGMFRLAYVGRLVEPQKRIHEVVEAMGRAAREVPGVEGVLIGEGPERASIEQTLRAGGSSAIRLAGRVEIDQVQRALLECHGLVLLSDFEGLPVALMEAMACGVVPICLRTRSGVDELVADGETGLLVGDRGDAFVGAVRALATDPALWRRLSEAARARVRADYSVERGAEAWIALGEELAAGGAGGSARIVVPREVVLPPVHTALAREDLRRQPWWRSTFARGLRPAGAARPAPAVLCVATRARTAQVETFVAAHLAGLPFDCRLLWGSPLPFRDASRPNLLGKSAFLRQLPRLWPDLLGLDAERIYERFHRVAIARYLRRTGARAVLAEFGWTGVAMLEACRAAGVPMVVHFHGNDAYGLDILERNALRYRELFAFAGAIVAVSRDMERQLLALGAPAEKVHRIIYGIDIERFRGADPSRSPPRLVAVGRFVEKKAPQLTLLAFAAVLRDEPAARLTMIGDGPLLGPCQAMADGLGIADRVDFLGSVQPPVVAREMAGARAFVQHSLRAADGDSEGTPVSILEAQASGLPVVATRHAGIPEVVLDGETGLLVAERDVDAMAAAMLRLLREPAYAGTMGAAGRRRVQELFTAERSLGLLADILRRVMGP